MCHTYKVINGDYASSILSLQLGRPPVWNAGHGTQGITLLLILHNLQKKVCCHCQPIVRQNNHISWQLPGVFPVTLHTTSSGSLVWLVEGLSNCVLTESFELCSFIKALVLKKMTAASPDQRGFAIARLIVLFIDLVFCKIISHGKTAFIQFCMLSAIGSYQQYTAFHHVQWIRWAGGWLITAFV